MDLLPSPEQALLAETAAAFAARAAEGAGGARAEAGDAGFDRATWSAMAELGWTELPALELALVAEQLGRHAVPSPLVVTAALRLALPTLAADLDPASIATLAAVVPGAADERAGPHPDTTGTLTGSFLVVPYAAAADVLVVATRAGLVTVKGDAPGVTHRRHSALGGDALWRVDLERVEHRRLDGAPGETLDHVLDHLAVLGLAATVGAAEGALALSVRHATDRHQFGRPIGSFQAVAHRCADMRAEIDACRALARRAAWALDGGTGRESAIASALAYSSDALRRVAMHAHQVHGAIGFSTEHDLHRFTRRIKAYELTTGSTAAHQERLARAIGLR